MCHIIFNFLSTLKLFIIQPIPSTPLKLMLPLLLPVVFPTDIGVVLPPIVFIGVFSLCRVVEFLLARLLRLSREIFLVV